MWINFILSGNNLTKGADKMKLPRHIGIIPDGNRRWARGQNLRKEEGYAKGLLPGVEAFKCCQKFGIEEVTFYGFTVDNTKRPREQTIAFTKACVEAVKMLEKEDAELLVVGNSESKMFPEELKPLTKRTKFGKGGTKVNFLVNYSWEWDLKGKVNYYNTSDISRVDLVIRWGGMRRLSGFLPVQSVYADFYVVDELWPDYKDEHIYNALDWYSKQDVTLGG